MEELVRLDKIRGPRLKAVLSAGKSPQNSSRQPRPTPYPSKFAPAAPRPKLSETYDPKELTFRPNPMMPNATPQWSYKFPTGKISFLSSPCTKCGGKHFNFECKKPRPGTTRAAFMLPEDSWDEFTTDTADQTDEEDELAVAYTAYPGYEPDPAEAYQTPMNRMQITDQP
jgi:hypothetical protein